MLRMILAWLVAAALATGVAHAQTRYDPDIQLRALLHDGEPRGVGLYVPSSLRTGQPAPLIVALHGRFSSPKALHAIAGLSAVAEARGAIVLYPESLNGTWNAGGHAILNRPDPPTDDIGFITSAIEAIGADYPIDRSRIFLVGYDSGGALAYALACQGRTQVAGVAVVSALMWDFMRDQCGGGRPAPVLIVHGRRDENAPAGGGDVPGTEARRLGVDDTLAVWRGINGCGAANANGREGSVFYSNCSSGAALAYVGVAGGAHDWFHTGTGYELNRQGVDATALVDTFLFNRAAFAPPLERACGRANARCGAAARTPQQRRWHGLHERHE